MFLLLFIGLAFSQFCCLLTLSLGAIGVPPGRPPLGVKCILSVCGTVGLLAATVAMVVIGVRLAFVPDH